MSRLFVQYDARAEYDVGEEPTVYQTADSEQEARRDGRDFPDGCWWEYESVPPKTGERAGKLINGKRREDLDPRPFVYRECVRVNFHITAMKSEEKP